MWRNLLRENVGRTVIVNTVAGKESAFRGTLEHVGRDVLVLGDAMLVEPQQVPLGGRIVVERRNVAWTQVL